MDAGSTTPHRVAASSTKRAFDATAAALALVVLSPVLIILAVLVRWKLGAPVLFLQERAGLNGRPFKIIKFRTMTDAKDDEGNLLPDHLRLTAFGKGLRSSSLDELPELINVLRGEMSLVGPRPLVVRYQSRYNAEQARRNLARPGVTGLAQVSGRNALTWEERFELDTKYIDEWSLLLDLKILLLTLGVVFSRAGVRSEGHATAPEFMGAAEQEEGSPHS